MFIFYVVAAKPVPVPSRSQSFSSESSTPGKLSGPSPTPGNTDLTASPQVSFSITTDGLIILVKELCTEKIDRTLLIDMDIISRHSVTYQKCYTRITLTYLSFHCI